jgi:UDP-glucose/GDP-mannose dehydrogenase family, UDP binding domain
MLVEGQPRRCAARGAVCCGLQHPLAAAGHCPWRNRRVSFRHHGVACGGRPNPLDHTSNREPQTGDPCGVMAVVNAALEMNFASPTFYLTHKAQEVGYHPEVILAGRRINDGMARYAADETVKLMLRKNIPVLQSKVLVLGLTFKKNCPDLRNTKVADIAKHLQGYNLQVDIFDPWIDPAEAVHEYGLTCLRELPQAASTNGSNPQGYAAIVLAVGHEQFVELGEAGIKALGQPGAVLFDVKSMLPRGRQMRGFECGRPRRAQDTFATQNRAFS